MIKFLLNNKIVKFFYGILLLPLCYSVFLTFIYIVKNIEFSYNPVKLFLFGAGSYLILHILLYKPIKIYIIGHELVHAISAYLCGAGVKNLKIGKSYGSVNVDKVNTFIALSPYFIPFYSIIVIFIWLLIKYLFKLNVPIEIFMFLLGFTIMFHLLLTIYAISLGQQDLKVSGWLFSVILIFIINCVILIILLITLFPLKTKIVEFKNYFLSLTFNTYKVCFEKILQIIKYSIKYFKEKTHENIQ